MYFSQDLNLSEASWGRLSVTRPVFFVCLCLYACAVSYHSSVCSVIISHYNKKKVFRLCRNPLLSLPRRQSQQTFSSLTKPDHIQQRSHDTWNIWAWITCIPHALDECSCSVLILNLYLGESPHQCHGHSIGPRSRVITAVLCHCLLIKQEFCDNSSQQSLGEVSVNAYLQFLFCAVFLGSGQQINSSIKSIIYIFFT